MSESSQAKKQTIIPLLLALLVPAGLVILLFANHRPVPVDAPTNDAVTEQQPAQMAYFQIKVLDTEGQPVENRNVTFLHEAPSDQNPGETTLITKVEKQTDSAGIATITLEKKGHVTIEVAGREKKEKFKDLELATSTLYELTVILEDSEKNIHE